MYQAGKLAYRMYESPALRQHFVGAVTNGLRENAPAMINNLDRLDHEMLRLEEKEKKERVKSHRLSQQLKKI